MSEFKRCVVCHTRWETLEAFRIDAAITPLGLVVDFEDVYSSLLLFNHSCGTTLAIEAESFRQLLPGLADELRLGQPGCAKHCLDFHDLEVCD